MSMKRKAVWTGLLVLRLANAAHAMSIKDFYNDAALSNDTQTAALLFSFTTEAFRSAQAGQTTRAQCLYENFIDGRPGFNALIEHMQRATNKEASVEDFTLRAIEAFCPSGGTAEVSPSPKYIFKPTSAEEFYKIVPDNANKITVLNLALTTQAERVKQTGDEVRGHCIDGVEVKILKDAAPVIPPAFKQDIMLKLATVARNPSSGDSLESILMTGIGPGEFDALPCDEARQSGASAWSGTMRKAGYADRRDPPETSAAVHPRVAGNQRVRGEGGLRVVHLRGGRILTV